MNGIYPAPQGGEPYAAQRVPLGFGVMFGTGTLSGSFGIGSGVVKVLAMDQAMKQPLELSTTTSNSVIGVAEPRAPEFTCPEATSFQIAMPVKLSCYSADCEQSI